MQQDTAVNNLWQAVVWQAIDDALAGSTEAQEWLRNPPPCIALLGIDIDEVLSCV